MSPLTKAFVILVTVLSILLVALVIPFVAETDDLQGQIGELESRVQAAESAKEIAQQDAAELRQNKDQADQQLQERLTRLLAENTDLRGQVNTGQGEYAKANDRIDSLLASQQIANESLNSTGQLLQSRTTLLEEAQANNVDFRREIAELITANSEFAAQVDGLTRTNRTLQEQLADANQALQSLAEGNQVGPQTPDPDQVAVQGSVTLVEDSAGIKLVQLNIGRNDNITENTRVALYRNDQDRTLVGLAEINLVEENVSVGRLVNQQLEPRVGDFATTNF